MPTVNIFFRDADHLLALEALTGSLREHVANVLSLGGVTPQAEEVSVRLVRVSGGAMMSPIELEITAYASPERVDRQDEICLATRSWLAERLPLLTEVQVWLLLCELGHSWEPSRS